MEYAELPQKWIPRGKHRAWGREERAWSGESQMSEVGASELDRTDGRCERTEVRGQKRGVGRRH